MDAGRPKQYLELAGRPLLDHALDALRALEPVAIAVVVAPEDPFVDGCALVPPVEVVRRGGAERAHSVLAGLEYLAPRAAAEDPVLVHDAARPCLTAALVRRLLGAAGTHPDGGLLAVPVSETVKRAAIDAPARVEESCDRSHLWLAQTPQLFPFGRLRAALRAALEGGRSVTDEASAMEAAGARPLLVEGSVRNLKVTRPEDLALARYWLAETAAEPAG
jgi:2-C-methyl-D-erythritol 4-phosphate cytidylyltransferase